MSLQKQQIIHANCNRFQEGARILEDIARFVLHDSDLFQAIKQLKHQVTSIDVVVDCHDIGGIHFKEEHQRHDLFDIIQANAKRMQQAARVLEEFTLDHDYKNIRFASYQIHQQLIVRYQHLLAEQQLQGIYPIIDANTCCLEKAADFINQEKLMICQLRIKTASKRDYYHAAMKLKSRLTDNTLLVINDHLDIALLTKSAVHLGQTDLPVKQAREFSDHDLIIGCSCHNLHEALQAQQDGASYIALGALYRSNTKTDATLIDHQQAKNIIEQIDIPVVGIGGIATENFSPLFQIGFSMIAVNILRLLPE